MEIPHCTLLHQFLTKFYKRIGFPFRINSCLMIVSCISKSLSYRI